VGYQALAAQTTHFRSISRRNIKLTKDLPKFRLKEGFGPIKIFRSQVFSNEGQPIGLGQSQNSQLIHQA
jgi:hypothetical protein